MKKTICTLALLFPLMASAATYNVGPGQAYTSIGSVPWSSLAPGDVVNIYPKTAITGVTTSSSTGTTIALTGSAASIPFGSSVWWPGFTGTKTWTTCGQYGSGLYGTATGGTACSGNTVTINDAETIGIGVTVYFTPPYFEKLIITAAGTVSQPITIQGVPDPTTGALPILDAHNATTGPNMAHHGAVEFWDATGFVLLTFNVDSTAWPNFVTLSNLRIQGSLTGVTNYDSTNAPYTVAGLGIRLNEAENVTINGNEIFNNDEGLFGATNGLDTCNWCQFQNNLTVRGNHFYFNGKASTKHQNYVESGGILYERNWFDKPAPGTGCSQLKDRSSGTIIRYNLFYPSARAIDLVDAQNSFDVVVHQVALTVPGAGFASGTTSLTFASSVAGISVGDRVGQKNGFPAWGYEGSGLALMPTVIAVDSGGNTLTVSPGLPAELTSGQIVNVISRQLYPYRQTFVYGNVFDYRQSLYSITPGVPIHYGWDSGGLTDVLADRAGTLYFYYNTFITQWDNSGSTGASYGFPLFQTESVADTIRADNNLFYVSNSPGSTNQPTYLTLLKAGAYTGTGLVSVAFSGRGNQVVSSLSMGSNTSCGFTLIGWVACKSATDPVSSVDISGFATETKAALYPTGVALGVPYLLQPGSTAIGAASALPAAIASNTLGLDLTPTLNYDGTARTSLADLGAMQYKGPPPVLNEINVTPPAASVLEGIGTQQYAAQCSYSDSTSSDCTAKVTWSSSNTAIATISSSGMASARAAGTTSITAVSGGVTGSAFLSVTISPTLTGITISPAAASIVAGTGAHPYAAQCSYSNSTSSDCTATVTWSSSNQAVATITSGGLAIGIAAGTTTIRAVSGSISGSSVLTVNAPTLILTTTSLAGAVVGTSYNVQLNASGGIAPYSWALTSGTLPGGLSLNNGGLISGTPTTPISATPLTFRVSDSNSSTALSSGLTLTVAGASLSLGLGTCSSTMTGTQYVPFSGCTLAASGGTPPYTYSWKVVTDGSYAALPEGLSLSSLTGTISGTVYGQGRYVPQFVVKDSLGATATLSTLFFSIAGDNSLGGCSLFPSDSIFHQRLDSLPVDTSPAAPIYSDYRSSPLRAFFGNTGNGNVPNGIPFIRVPYNQANISVTTTLYQSYFFLGPFPSYTPPEATSNNHGDRHVLVVQAAGGGNPCRLWEMWEGIYQTGGTWSDSSNAYWSNIGSTGTGAYSMLPQDNGSTDAAGLPVAPLLVTADEVIGTGTPSTPNGSVQHPVRFTVNHMLNRYVWPATAHSGTGSCSGGYTNGDGMLLQGAGAPASCTMTGPAGEIYRLKASVANPACEAASPQAAIIIQGFRHYGIILADNGMTGGLIGTPDSRWNDSDLACLTSLTLSDFEPVNVLGTAATLTPNYNGSGYGAPVTSYQTTSGAPTLTGISVTPASASILAVTGAQQYSAHCSYSNSTSSDCTANVTWSSSTISVATISASGLASGLAAGTSTIKATSGTVSGTAILTAISPTLTGISVTPSGASIAAGTGTQQFTAQCSYSNTTSADCTATMRWSSTNTAAATINSAGLAIGVAAGTSTIRAISGSVSGSAVLTVTNAVLTGIMLTPATASIVAGTGTRQYTAQCSYSNSTNADCTATVTWSSSNTAAATINSTGLAIGVAAGTSTIKATSGNISGSTALTVTVAALTGISLSPATASIVAATGSQQYAAQCSYSNSSSSDCTPTVTWSSSSPAVATISTSGLAKAVGAGSTTIKAASGSVAGSAVLTVTPVPVDLTSGLWTWMGGGSIAPGTSKGQPGTYSTFGSPSAGNVPGSREASVRWTDNNGSLWLFGGGGYDSAGVDGYLNDLWEFIPAMEQWAWMGGSSTVPSANKGWPGVYGTLGTAAAGNSPGGRQASVSWTDKTGNLWLFGGVGYDSAGANGSLNDLWKYLPSTQEWAWMGGSSTVPADNNGQPGVYGHPGVPDAANTPGGRWGANSWTDMSGNLWLFGGVGYDSAGSVGSLNDLWELNPSTGKWAWISGSNMVGSGGGQSGVYGSLANPSATNVPSGRSQAVSWTDSNGSFWLFGGKGYDSTGTFGYLNDVWEFNPSTREWAWMGGSSTFGCTGCSNVGIYGTQGETDSANIPGGRNQAVGWTDSGGNFWLLGGNGYDSAGTNGILNDLWEFLPSTREWAWMGGSNTVPAASAGQTGVYGNLGVPSAGNTPGGRWGAGSWTDGEGNLWLFGGAGYDSQGTYDDLNDLWVYQPSPGNLPAATPTLSVVSGTYNTPQTVTISDVTPGATIYYTTNGATPNTGSSVYSGPITVSTTMTVEAIALANGYKASAAASATYTLTSSFSIAAQASSATNVTIQPGGVATYSLVVAPIDGTTFPAAITFAASGNPSGSTVTFTPASVAAGLGTTNVSLSIKTSTASASIVPARSNWTIAICVLFLPLIGIRRWRHWGKQFSVRTRIVGGIMLLAGLTIAISGCSGTVINNNTGSRTGTPASYTVTVTGTSGNVHQKTTFTLTLQ